MKVPKWIYFTLLSGLVPVLSGCADSSVITDPPVSPTFETMTVPPNFNFQTSHEVSVSISVKSTDGAAMPGIPVTIAHSATENGSVELASFISDEAGDIQGEISVPGYIDTLFLTSNFIGIPNQIAVYPVGSTLTYTYNKPLPASSSTNGAIPYSSLAVNYRTLGTWNNSGVPKYLLPKRDVITTSLLNNINASLPERAAVPIHHPQYITVGTGTNIVLKDSAEVFVTFVHEGAGFTNVLGFYTYKSTSPPSSVAQVESTMTIVLPNASFAGSGGGLYSGDKVKLGNFGANTVIGWFLLANGFRSPNVTNGNWRLFSNPEFNPESSPSLRQHNVLLNDQNNSRIIIGFEDWRRDDSPCDNDFNDLLFYVTANPFTAVVTNNIAILDSAIDSDNDGVLDQSDQYKNDPARAFNTYFPSKTTNGTLVYEDLWPAKGDYDFNDLVVDYQYNLVTNAQNNVVDCIGDFTIKAVGASYKNAFGFQLGLPSSKIASVTGQKLTEGYISLQSNGTEAGQQLATIMVFDDPINLLRGSGSTVNTDPASTYFTPVKIRITVNLTTPVSIASLGTSPFNPFLVINKERGRELHLAGSAPTTLADKSLFGKNDDRTNISSGVYYKSAKNLPWALHLTDPFKYPIEKAPLISAYNYFVNWAESGGTSYKDWYLIKTGYQNGAKIYPK